ncbi:MAG: sugar transferase [Acidobacteriota bacterium]
MSDAVCRLAGSLTSEKFKRPVRLTLSERKSLLVLGDVIALSLALPLAVEICLRLDPQKYASIAAAIADPFGWRPGRTPLLWAPLLVFFWCPLAAALGAYDSDQAFAPRKAASTLAKAVLATLIFFVFFPYATPFLGAPIMVLTQVVVALVIVIGTRLLLTRVLTGPRFVPRTLIVGAGWAGQTICEVLDSLPECSGRVVGFVDDDSDKAGQQIAESRSRGYRVLGDRKDLKKLVCEHGVTVIVVAITETVPGDLLQTLLEAAESGVEVIPMPVLYEEITEKVPVQHVGQHWSIVMPPAHKSQSLFAAALKRAVDICLGSVGLFCLLPFIPFISVAIYLESPGPVFYRQERVGKGGRIFKVWKFRSMVLDAENGRPVWASKDDPRVTRVGRLLRATHFDEFPQFLNILKGDMSAVGPRPERPEFVEELEKIIPFYRIRHTVKPGMAGWGLVRQGYGASREDALEKIQYDLYYIRHHSLFLDLTILLRTFIDTLTFRGR